MNDSISRPSAALSGPAGIGAERSASRSSPGPLLLLLLEGDEVGSNSRPSSDGAEADGAGERVGSGEPKSMPPKSAPTSTFGAGAGGGGAVAAGAGAGGRSAKSKLN